MKILRPWHALAPCVAILLLPASAGALVEGERHALYAEHTVFGGAAVTGNTLMTASIAAPEVNSGLLPRSAGDVRELPFDAELQGAYLFWTGSIAGRPDRTADLTAADGTFFDDVQADRCVTTNALGGFFYCRKDVTELLRPHPGPQQYNGTYFVGDVQAEPGFLNQDGTCQEPQECQAKYAAWSLVLVYEAESATTLRDVFVHDGFRQLDETPQSPGIDQFTIRGFDFPANGNARLTFLALEGDSFLGVPPQDTDPIFPCPTCFDFMEFGGAKLSDALNPPNNLFNSSSPGGFTLGLDLDTFDVSDLLRVGDRQVVLRPGSGDGVVDVGMPDPSGGGESFFLGFVLLQVDRNAPNFRRDGTVLSVVPDEAAPAERVVFTLRLENEGTLDSPNTVVRLPLPDGLTYLPDSLRVDGDAVLGANNPLRDGLNVGNIPFRGDNDVVITFRATIDQATPPGSRLVSRASIGSDNLEGPVDTNEAVVVVLGALSVERADKTVTDLDGNGRFEPGDFVRYTITIPNPNDRAVFGATLTDRVPRFLDVDAGQVFATSGEVEVQPDQNRVTVREIVIPARGAARITILAVIHESARLIENDGIPPGMLNGFRVANQGLVVAGGREVVTDDPDTPAQGDPTVFELSSDVDITGPETRKRGEDVNGGFLEPGDRIRYTLQIRNSGSAPAEVLVDDPLPPTVEDCRIESVHPASICAGKPLVVTVDAGETERIVFSVAVRADTPHDTVIENVATVRVVGDPDQRAELRSERLRVFFSPSLTEASKQAVGADNGVALPGQVIRYVIRVPNTGNRRATNVVVSDALEFAFADVAIEGGGARDGDTITWNIAAIEPGATAEVAFVATLPDAIPNGTEIPNQARVAAAELPVAEPSDDPTTAEANDPTVVVVRSEPRLVLLKEAAPRVAAPGDEVTYILTVRNTGSEDARQVVLADVLPFGGEPDDVYVNVVPEGGVLDGDTARFGPFDLAVDEERRFTVRARLAEVLRDGLEVPNQATADAENAEAARSDDPATPDPLDPTVVRIDSTPALELDKAVIDLNGGDVQPGDRLRYTLTVRSVGDAPAEQVVVTDPLPAQLEDVAVENGGVRKGDTLIWQLLQPVAPGAPAVLSFEGTVSPQAAPGARVSNQAAVAAIDVAERLSDDPATAAPGDPTEVVVVSRPDLSTSTKTVEPREAEPGQAVVFRIQVVNSGTAAAADVRVTDALPADLLNPQVNAGGRVANGQASWSIPALAPQARVELTVSGVVRRPLADGTELRNQATLVADGLAPALSDDPATPEPDDPTVLNVRSAPALEVSKTVADPNGAPVQPGDELVYTLTVTNTGGTAAAGVTLRDPIDANLAVTDPGGAQVQGGALVWALGDVPVDAPVQRVFRARVADALGNGTNIRNQAQALADNLVGPVPSDDPSTPAPGDPTVVQVVSAADFSGATKAVAGLDGPEFRPGTRVRYTIEVQNQGDDVARAVVVRDALPAELEFVRAPGGQAMGGVVTWALGDLAPGEARRVTLTARIVFPLADGTVVSNRAEVNAEGFAMPFLTDDPETPGEDATAFTVVARAQVALTKRLEVAGEAVRPGDAITYVLELDNEGDAPASDLEVIDPLPAGLEQIQVPPPAVLKGDTVVWRVPVLVPGEPQELRIAARVPDDAADGDRFENRARVGELLSDDPNTPAPDATVFVVEDRADLRASTKAVSGDFEPGGLVEYPITVTNGGTRQAQNVVVADPLPPELELVGTRPAAEQVKGRLVWRLGDLAAGQSVQILVRAQIAEDVADGAVVSNQAEISATGLPLALSDDPATPQIVDDPTAFEVLARPVLELVKRARDDDGGRFNPGDPITWLLEIRNTGNRVAEGVEVIDPFDARLTNAVAVGGEIDDGTARWTVEAIPPGESVTLELRARIPLDIEDGVELTNQFGARIGPAGRFDLSEQISIVVDAGVGDLQFTKTVQPLQPEGFVPGGRVRYTLLLRNVGDAPVDRVAVVDPIDLGRLGDLQIDDGGFFDGQRIEWTVERNAALQRIPPDGQVRLVFEAIILAEALPGDRVRNQAEAFVLGEDGSVLSDDPDTEAPDDATVFTVGGGGRLRVEKRVAAPADPAQLLPGATVLYRIDVRNDGDAPVRLPLLIDRIAPQVEYAPGTTLAGGQPVPDVGGRPAFERGLQLAESIPAGGVVSVVFEVRIPEDTAFGTRVVNQAEVRDGGGAVVLSDDPTTPQPNDATVFIVGGAVEVGPFLKTATIIGGGDGTGRARIGDVIEWSLQVRNEGNAPARGFTVLDELPGRTRYVEGSISLDQQPLSDPAGDDAGELVGGTLTVRIDQVPPRATRVVRYRTEVLEGPFVENQARLRVEGQRDRLSDDGQGNGPTVVQVGEAPRRSMLVEKTRIDGEAGAEVLAGQTVDYQITLRNTGTVALDTLQVVDDLPAGTVFEQVLDLPPGVDARFEPAPAGRFQNGRVVFEGLGVDVDSELRLRLRLRIDPTLREDRPGICNQALGTGVGVAPAESEPICVDAVVRFGRMRGTIFQNLDDEPGYQVDRDAVFEGMRVGLWSEADLDGEPVVEATTDALGAYALDDLLPGRYRVRIFSSEAVLLRSIDGLELDPGEQLDVDLLIDPSGRIYDSVGGDPIDGAEVFIYHDLDADDDPYDAESQQLRVLVDPDDLEAPSQQGQRTAHGGLYKFAVRRPGRYLVEVLPPGQSLVSPSVLVPPTPGYAFTDDPDGRVVEADLPEVEPDSDRTYFLAFELNDAGDLFTNNHIPLDPLSSLIDIDKRSGRPTATVGSIVTYQVDVTNRSPEDLLLDPATGIGGVFIQDVLPSGFKYINGSAVLLQVVDGRERAVAADDPRGERILLFGRARREDNGRVLRGIDLPAGGSIRLKYQAVVGVNTQPKRKYTNRATLLLNGTTAISREARAEVLVVADPDFDQGLLLGKVFCDANGDGWQDEGEHGLGGARIYLDNGYYAVTDGAGKFHFKDIDPGTHAVKIDAHTLLPGAALTTDETRVIHFTRGLPAKVSFGVTCPSETVTGAQLELGEAGLKKVLENLRTRYVVVAGNVNALQARFPAPDGTQSLVEAPLVGLSLLVDGERRERPDLEPRAGGAQGELAFRTALGPGAQASRWAIWVGPVGGDEVMVASGTGAPPAVVPWDQRGPEGLPVLSRGKAFTYRLEVGNSQGQLVGSPAGVFGVGKNAPGEPDLIAAFPADGFVRGRPGRRHRKALDELKGRLDQLPGTLLVVVHADSSRPDEEAAAQTQKHAEALKRYLVERLKRPADRVEAVGAGSTRPLYPNISERNRERNRRVEIRHRTDAEKSAPRTVDDVQPAFSAVARAGRQSAVPEPGGEFALTTEVPEDGVVELYMRATDGRRAVIPLSVRAGSARKRGAPREVAVQGTPPDGLTLGGAKVEPRGLKVKVQAPEVVEVNEGKLAAPVRFELDPGEPVTSWRFAVRAPDGTLVFEERGDGAPPEALAWGEANAPLRPGHYPYRLTVRTRSQAVGQSAEATLRVGQLTGPVRGQAADQGEWGLRLDGQALRKDPDGRFFAPLTVRGDEAVLFEIVRPDGGRGVFFVRPPQVAAEGQAAVAAAPPQSDRVTVDGPAVGGGAYVDPAGRTANDYRKLGPDNQPMAAGDAPLPDRPEVMPPRALPPDERARIEAFGRAELNRVLAPLVEQEQDVDVPARTLSVQLPPAGAEVHGNTLPVHGTTAPGNQVYLNGVEVAVDGEGRFSGAAPLKPGQGIEVRTVDPLGNRGVIRRDLQVAESGWFLLALGEGLSGFAGSELDGVQSHTRTKVGDTVYLHGRATAYFKGYAKGSEILGGVFDHYDVTAHVDTARLDDEQEAYFRQLIDPETFYPVYGDSAEEVKDVHTRGPLYVMLKADESRFVVGNFKTDIRGVELLRYERALYGVGVDLDKKTGDFRHEVKAFVADQDQPERHAYIELRGTGGSLYYLPHRDLIEGSDRVFLVERDRVTGIERSRVPLARDIDYTVRYLDGRILMKTPVPSVTLNAFGALPEPGRNDVLDGHPVYLSVEYDHRDIAGFGETAWGVHAQETWKDAVSVGGGYIEEGRGNNGMADYKLWGANLQLRHQRRTRMEAEFARSESFNGDNLFSEDGGLTFRPFNFRDGEDARGTAFLLRGGLELDDFLGEGNRDHWYTEGYWQYIGEGYYAGGTIQQQGLEKYGGLSRYWFNPHHNIRIQHDGMTAAEPATQGFGVFTGFQREVTRAGYGYVDKTLKLDTEFIHTQSDEGLSAEEGGIFVTDAIAQSAQYKLTSAWTLLGEQEVIVRGDARLHDETMDLFLTTVGVRYQATQKLQVELLESVRWSGDNATQLGVRSILSDRHTVYAHERVATQDGRTTTTSVVGGEERWGDNLSGRAYGEYQLETGVFGPRNRAVLGLGKRTHLTRKLVLDNAYERSQVTGGTTGEFSQDAVSLGVEWLDKDFLKISGRYELRYEDNDERFAMRDRWQFLTLNGIALKVHRDLTLLIRGNYSHTFDLDVEATEAELIEFSTGLAYRPVHFDWVIVLFKYTKRFEQRPIDTLNELPEREEADVVSLIPIFELPWGFQIVEKIAFKRSALRVAQLPTQVSHTILSINRLNYHLTEQWDAGVEYRFLHNDLSSGTLHGALTEINYIIQKKVRLGVGYNFTSFSDDEFASLNEDHGGPFFRVTAHY